MGELEGRGGSRVSETGGSQYKKALKICRWSRIGHRDLELSFKEGTRDLIIVVLKSCFSGQSRACSVVVPTRFFDDFFPKRSLWILDGGVRTPGTSPWIRT